MAKKTAAPGDEWKCSSCTRVDQSIPMIGCDSCDSWFHWSCVGIVVEPRKEDVWICSDCRRVKPVKKQKDKFKVSSSSSYSAQPSSTRPGSSGASTARASGPVLKTGSGHQTKKSSSSGKQQSSSSSPAILAATSVTVSERTGTTGSQGWMCASCKTW